MNEPLQGEAVLTLCAGRPNLYKTPATLSACFYLYNRGVLQSILFTLPSQ